MTRRDWMQVVPAATNQPSSWGPKSWGQLVPTDISNTVGRGQVDVSSGLALYAMPSGGSGTQSGHVLPDQQVGIGGYGIGRTNATVVIGDDDSITWRWRFGLSTDYALDNPYGWCAVLSSGENFDDVSSSVYSTSKPGWNAFLGPWDDGIWGYGSPTRFLAIGQGFETGSGVVLVARNHPGAMCPPSLIMPLGLQWRPGDLFTWDVTVKGGADVKHKVWRQRRIWSAPDVAEFTVPYLTHPWVGGPPQGPTSTSVKVTAGYRRYENGAWQWRYVTETATFNRYRLDVDFPPPLPGESVYAGAGMWATDVDGGSLDGDYHSGSALAGIHLTLSYTGEPLLIRVGASGPGFTDTTPDYSGNPAWWVNADVSQPQWPLAVSLQTINETGGAMRWAGFLTPRTQSGYGIVGKPPVILNDYDSGGAGVDYTDTLDGGNAATTLWDLDFDLGGAVWL